MENYTIEQLEDEIIRRRTEAEHRFLPATTTMATTNLRKVLENIESIRATSRAIIDDVESLKELYERVKKDGISPAQEKYVNEIINKRKKELEQ